MALARVPIVPQWNLSNGCVATPDGGFLYIGSKTINYISKVQDGNDGAASPPIIKVFYMRQQILSLDIDPVWMAENASAEQKYFAVLAQDNCVQVWDFEKGTVVCAHKAHISRQSMEGSGPRERDKVLLSYRCNRNILSLSSFELVLYCVASNTFCRRPTFISMRNQSLTVLRCSPYDENIFAVGTSRGWILLCDLQQMKILYTLRGHEASITALSWNELNTAEQLPDNMETKITSSEMQRDASVCITNETDTQGNDDIFDIYDYNYLENEFGAPTIDENLSREFAERVGIEQAIGSTKFDFVEACQNLREEIAALQQDEGEQGEGDGVVIVRAEVTLKDCQTENKGGDVTSSCDEGSSTEHSSKVTRSSDDEDDDVGIDGAKMNAAKKPDCLTSNCVVPKVEQIVHTTIVHSSQTSEEHQKELPTNGTDTKLESAIDAQHLEVQPHETPENAQTKQTHEKEPNNGNRDILLASASSDGTIWIWNTETGGACDHQRSRGAAQHGRNTHVEILWLNGNSLLTTNRLGEMTLWNCLPNTKQQHLRRCKLVEDKRQLSQHSVVGFSICPDNETIWTISSNREIYCENICTQRVLAKYCCASTHIGAMRECPDDMNKIALGFSDKRVGIIDISNLSSTNVSIENYTTRVDSIVLSLVWSPDNKKLAFGTIDGTIGVINVENPKITPYTYHPFCGRQIYSIDWQDHYIYVACNEKLGVYEEGRHNRDAEILHNIQSVSAISVRKDFLFVGTQRGNLRIYRRNRTSTQQQKLMFDLIRDFELSSRYITEISWSPIDTEQFAVVSMANKISILSFNFDAAFATHVRQIQIKNLKTANTCVKWSNRNKHELLTCGNDGTVRIWDLNSSADIEKFLKQFYCPMTCGLFLPTDERIIMCAGKSTSIEFFDISTETSAEFSQRKWLRLNANNLEHVQWATKVPARIEANVSITAAEKRRQRKARNNSRTPREDVDEEKEREKEKESAFNVSAATTAESADVVILSNNNNITNAEISSAVAVNGKKENGKGEISNMMKHLNIEESEKDASAGKSQKCGEEVSTYNGGSSAFMKVPATLLCMTTKEINKDALEKLSLVLNNDYNLKFIMAAKLFGRRSDAKDLMAEELRNHQNSECKGIVQLIMPQLQYSYKDEIIKCIQKKQLNEWHISLAPSISYSFWLKCCIAFAEQLLEQGYAIQAATYMIAIHDQNGAIRMLLERNYFKEALLIGRVYMQPDDPLLNTITDKWIGYLDVTGNFAGAALVCALSGQMNRAYEVLSKVRNMQPEVEKVMQLLRMKKNNFDNF